MATATKAYTKTIEREAPANNLLEEAIAITQRRQGVCVSAAASLGVEPAKLYELLRNVWKTSKGQDPLTQQEMFVGISMIARFELDPIAREVYVTRTKNGLVTIIGIDGWVKILDRTDHYDGFTVEINRNEAGVVDWIETKIYSTKRTHPSVYRAFASEYEKVSGFVAKDMPLHMLRTFSFRHAARLFVPLGGNVMTEDEAMFMQANDGGSRSQKPVPLSEIVEQQYEPEATKESGLAGVKELMLATDDSGTIGKIATDIRNNRELTNDELNELQEMENGHKARCRSGAKGDAHEG